MTIASDSLDALLSTESLLPQAVSKVAETTAAKGARSRERVIFMNYAFHGLFDEVAACDEKLRRNQPTKENTTSITKARAITKIAPPSISP